jgi:uncharacterized protein (DUF2164 family)
LAITLETGARDYLLGSIKRFFEEELDESIGDMKAARVLEFVLKEIGPSLYNQAMADAQAYFQEKASELGDVRYQPEFDFWKKRA